MQPEAIAADEHVRDIVLASRILFQEYWWAIASMLLLIICKDLLIQMGAGVVWKLGRRYNETDVVIVDEFFCRIAKIGFWNVEFYVYDMIQDPPKVAWTWLVSNDELRKKSIWKPLPKHEPLHGAVQRVTSIPQSS